MATFSLQDLSIDTGNHHYTNLTDLIHLFMSCSIAVKPILLKKNFFHKVSTNHVNANTTRKTAETAENPARLHKPLL